MNSAFLDSLRNQQPLFDAILNACHRQTMPVFVDLCWGDAFELSTAFRDLGIQLDAQDRRLVLMRVENEIRYYIGPNDPFADEQPQEIGILLSESDALSFAYEYLVKHLPLSEIRVKRIVRSRTSQGK